MYGRRRYYKRRSYIPRPMKKYSVENIMLSDTLVHGGTGWEWPLSGGVPVAYNVVNPAQFVIDTVTQTIQGTRKVKNFSMTLLANIERPILWALVYKPEGVDVKALTPTGGSVYEPNQNVLMTGVFERGQQNKWFTKLGRNLNSGDSIVLLLAAYSEDAQNIYWGAQITYAVAF